MIRKNFAFATIAAALHTQRALILARYRKDLAQLSGALSQSISRVAVSDCSTEASAAIASSIVMPPMETPLTETPLRNVLELTIA